MNEQESKKEHSKLKKILFFCILFLILLYSYMHFIEPNYIVVKEYAIIDNALPYSFHGLKIVQFSDILYGNNTNEKTLENMVKKINEMNPDIVLFTGDLTSKSVYINEEAETQLKNILSNIHANLKKYAVIGDNDYLDKIRYMNILENAEFTILNNKNDILYYKGETPILFIGTSSLLEQEYSLEDAIANTDDLSTYYKIWLNHEPIIMDHLKEFNVKPNLIFAGHTLGGLIKLPFGYSLLQQNGIQEYTEDFYTNENMKMYINTGIGTYKYNIRFLNPPSISLYRLYQY